MKSQEIQKKKLTKKTFDKKRIIKRKVGIGNKNVVRWKHSYFMDWWWNTPHICFECGEVVEGRYDPQKIHHLILQSKQKNYSIDIIHNEENIVKLHWRCHSQVHLNIDKTPNVKQATERIKEKYSEYRI